MERGDARGLAEAARRVGAARAVVADPVRSGVRTSAMAAMLASDIAAISLLTYASNGISSGLSLLLLTTLAASGDLPGFSSALRRILLVVGAVGALGGVAARAPPAMT